MRGKPSGGVRLAAQIEVEGIARPRLEEWSRRYETASARERQGDLAAIGQEMFGWLGMRASAD